MTSQPNDAPEIRDESLLEYWTEFRKNYVALGYRAASYEYFAVWLSNLMPAAKELDAETIQRRLHTHRKRKRSRDRRNPAD